MMYLHENVFGDIQMFINKFSSTMNQSNAKRNYSTVSDAQRPDTHTFNDSTCCVTHKIANTALKFRCLMDAQHYFTNLRKMSNVFP